MPVVSAVYNYQPTSERFSLVRDSSTEPGLVQYIKQSQIVEDYIHVIINNLVQEGLPVIVWGVGTHTLRLLETSRLSSANIKAFVDSNPRYHHKILENIPIIGPSELATRPETIFISSRVFQDEIERQIREKMGLSNGIIKLYL
jgi:hypothetical protein